MQITIIAAIDKANALGKDNSLAWHLPNDLQFFKRSTLHSPMIMGRKTFESFGARPLPQRKHVILSRQPQLYVFEQVEWANTLEEAFDKAFDGGFGEVFIIGGGELYHQTLSMATRLLITHVDTEIADADTYFPEIDTEQYAVNVVMEQEANATHAHSFVIKEYIKHKR